MAESTGSARRPTRDGKIRLAKLARIDHQLAELHGRMAELLAQRARLFDEMSDSEVSSLTTGRKTPVRCEPQLPPVSDTDRARARAALREADIRRRMRGG